MDGGDGGYGGGPDRRRGAMVAAVVVAMVVASLVAMRVAVVVVAVEGAASRMPTASRSRTTKVPHP